jgi:hypothetical protein
VVGVDLLLLFFGEIFDLVEDVLQSNGDGSLIDGKLTYGFSDVVCSAFHADCKDW